MTVSPSGATHSYGGLSSDLAGIPDHLQGQLASMRLKISRLTRTLEGRRTTLELLESENGRLKAMIADQRDYASTLLKRARKAEAELRAAKADIRSLSELMAFV